MELENFLFFIIPYSKNKEFIYFPMINKVYLNEKSDYSKNNIKKLFSQDLEKSKKIFETEFNSKKGYERKKIFPAGLVTIPNDNCNMRCTYCYARSNIGKELNFEAYIAAVDYVVANYKSIGYIPNTFVGGGEPTYNFKLFKKMVEYFKEMVPLKKRWLEITTNGLFNKEVCDYLLANFNQINISFDGPPEVQNSQRPTVNNKPSFNIVYSNIKYIHKKLNKNQGILIQGTVNKNNLSKINKIKDFFKQNLPGVECVIDGAFDLGRAKDNHNCSDKSIVFHSKYSDLRRLYPKKGFRRCAMYGLVLSITASGKLTGCVHVSKPDDENYEHFIYGRYDDEKKKLVFDKNKLDYMKKRNVMNISNCKNCFAKFDCGGSCPQKVLTSCGDDYDTSKYFFCQYERMYLIQRFCSALNIPFNKNEMISLLKNNITFK
ncbi:radical SAM protein [Candidatus Woesearchaeota archaeon]|nr:radical SAM protein [Candidatus Woesearchaeota archaeon]